MATASTGSSLLINRQQFAEVFDMIESVNPKANPRIWQKGLLRIGQAVQRDARLNQIKRRGINANVDPNHLTRRTGQLAGTIAVDERKIPREVSVYTNSPYGGVHEYGGLIAFAAHTRKSKKGNIFKVRAHHKKYPARPYLSPALDATVPKIPDIMVAVIEEELGK